MTLRVGVDTGGTFTDVVVVDDGSGTVEFHKLPSTPDDPSTAILDGVEQVVMALGIQSALTFLGHGTTIGTNAVLEGKFARTGLVATKGFTDVIELGRQRRPDLYDLDIEKPPAVAPRDLRWAVDERIRYNGEVIAAPDMRQLDRVLAALESSRLEAVAIVFLHSYVNPAHERQVRDLIKSRLPDLRVCASSDILPEFREYERTATTLLNASLMPVMTRYIQLLEKRVLGLYPTAVPRIMQSSGGLMGLAAAAETPLSTLASGPSAGVIAAAHTATSAGYANLMTFDVGGTSTDVCLVENGQPAFKHDRPVVGHPTKIPTVDVQSVGAGGGSIAFVDEGGLLKVGPASAGAWPGPACYGRGGTSPTVTDANVVLGYLNPAHLLGGRMAIDATLAAEAIQRDISDPLGISLNEAAMGIVRVVGANMQRAIRVISVEQGRDPRELTLVAFGGAGPLHASQLAADMGIPRVLVPENPGVLSALGLLMADVRSDFGRTVLVKADGAPPTQLVSVFGELESQARDWLRREGIGRSSSRILRTVDMSYVGQAYELPVTVKTTRELRTITSLVGRFHAEHERVYGYSAPDAPCQFVNARVTALGLTPRLHLAARAARVSENVQPVRPRKRQACFPGGMFECSVYDRHQMVPGLTLVGPVIIEQLDTTTVVRPNQSVTVDANLNLLIEPLDRE